MKQLLAAGSLKRTQKVKRKKKFIAVEVRCPSDVRPGFSFEPCQVRRMEKIMSRRNKRQRQGALLYGQEDEIFFSDFLLGFRLRTLSNSLLELHFRFLAFVLARQMELRRSPLQPCRPGAPQHFQMKFS